MFIFSNHYILIIILIILNIKYITCSTATFNNTVIISNCTNEVPCDLSSKSVWNDNIAPSDGDDVIIDFSTVVSQTSDVYLLVNNLNIQLNSFQLNGPQQTENFQINLNIQNSNLTIAGDFNAQYSNITFAETENSCTISINNFVSNQNNLTFNGYTNFVCNTTTLIGTEYVFLRDDSTFTVNSTATIKAPITHLSSGFLNFNGISTIQKSFYSSGSVQFGTQTNISSQAILNTTILVGRLDIDSSLIFLMVDYIQMNSSSIIVVSNKSSVSLLGTINKNNNYSNQILLLDNSSLFLELGFYISDMGSPMYGTIFIDQSLSTTTISSVQQPYLSISSKSNITLLSSTLNTVNITNYQTSLTVEESSVVSSINNFGETNILNDATLIVKNPSTTLNLNVTGNTTLEQGFSAKTIYINSNCLLFSNSSIEIQDFGLLTLYPSGLYVQNNLTLEPNSTLQILNATLNNKLPLIQVNGSVNLNSIILSIVLANNVKVTSEEKILLFSNKNSTIDISSIQLLTFASTDTISYIKYKIDQDNKGNVNLVFFDEIDKKTIIIYCSVIGSVLGLVFFVTIVFVIRKKLSHNQHHYDHGHHYERESLIH
ncbi:hypothetical protein DICPUDRAFT_77127 [Dictyostelium purpureum]|uniref:Uncharacterized protein n=1 Tax=Dictyostelium purpureum TaxID=5786 RepID=F0ZFP0_DICPU|nr:uncharacterized protein DICPUDRAFT_77127 [Dictyostelium purpureum]EGC37267.1 hypothetical protein DICPUDRAFT_77127 [Dictyostelium purpureum]|eukprot:XP_003286237.1 hypothetical protein DICPUDRAFT_77127 [Dictyostelium purpureum]